MPIDEEEEVEFLTNKKILNANYVLAVVGIVSLVIMLVNSIIGGAYLLTLYFPISLGVGGCVVIGFYMIVYLIFSTLVEYIDIQREK